MHRNIERFDNIELFDNIDRFDNIECFDDIERFDDGCWWSAAGSVECRIGRFDIPGIEVVCIENIERFDNVGRFDDGGCVGGGGRWPEVVLTAWPTVDRHLG